MTALPTYETSPKNNDVMNIMHINDQNYFDPSMSLEDSGNARYGRLN